MQIVIDIDDGKLWQIKNEPIKKNFNIYELASYIDKGIPLPKGHGELKDMGNLKYVFDLSKDDPIYSGKDIERAIKSMTTVIEAESEE